MCNDNSRKTMPPYRELLRRSLLVLAVTTALVAVGYFWLDRPIARYVAETGIHYSDVVRRVTNFPMWLNALAPVVALVAVVRLACAPLRRWERTAFAASISLMVAIAFEYYLKFLAGRYWPETWTHRNPSLLGTGGYGFHPFHFGDWYGSFPSGHTLRTAAVFAVIGIAYPRTRLLGTVIVLVVMLALIGMNYHFLSDTIGGAAVGYLTASYTAAFFGLRTLNDAARPSDK